MNCNHVSIPEGCEVGPQSGTGRFPGNGQPSGEPRITGCGGKDTHRHRHTHTHTHIQTQPTDTHTILNMFNIADAMLNIMVG